MRVLLASIFVVVKILCVCVLARVQVLPHLLHVRQLRVCAAVHPEGAQLAAKVPLLPLGDVSGGCGLVPGVDVSGVLVLRSCGPRVGRNHLQVH